MDKLQAGRLYQTLKNKVIAGYIVIDLINNGKSAAVFKAVDSNGSAYALKIFDNELIEKFGLEIQQKRITQELSLIGHNISNLVDIIDGGHEMVNGTEFHFIVMEFIEGKNLKEFITTHDYDQNFILKTLRSMLIATNELLKKGIAHRDLKPENIMVSSSGEIIIMDLGVLKYVGAKSLTDDLERQFLGTLRYAPPEYLMRREEDSLDGWRAVNLYQIGGVLHDLITKTELFYDKHPYANLVIAIKEDAPQVIGNYDYELLQLTRDLLMKDWKTRLEICSENRLQRVLDIDNGVKIDLENEISEINELRSINKIRFEEIENIRRSTNERRQKRDQISTALRKVIEASLKILATHKIYEAVNMSFLFPTDSKTSSNSETTSKLMLCSLKGDLSIGYPQDLGLIVKVTNNESGYCKIQSLAFFSPSIYAINLQNPKAFLSSITNNAFGNDVDVLPPYFEVFEGAFEADDSLNKVLTLKFLQLVKSALSHVQDIVKDQLEERERGLLGKQSVEIKRPFNKAIFFNSIDAKWI